MAAAMAKAEICIFSVQLFSVTDTLTQAPHTSLPCPKVQFGI